MSKRKPRAAKARGTIGSEEDATDRIRIRGPLTQTETAKLLGLSQGRILQLEQSAFRKLGIRPDLQTCRTETKGS